MIRILFRFIIYPSCERALKNGSVKSIIENRLWTSLLARAAVLYQNLLGQTQTKPYWSKFFLRFEIAILNNNFVFRMMSSFCSMARVAGCILAREMIKCANVFYSACLKKYWKKLDKHLWRGLFCERWAITHRSLLKINQRPC